MLRNSYLKDHDLKLFNVRIKKIKTIKIPTLKKGSVTGGKWMYSVKKNKKEILYNRYISLFPFDLKVLSAYKKSRR